MKKPDFKSLALALCLDARQGLCEDLKILVMSATLDGGAVARLLGDAPLLPFLGPCGGHESRTVGKRFSATLRGIQARSVLNICWL